MLLSDFLLLLDRKDFEPDNDGYIQYHLTINGEDIYHLMRSDVVKKYRDCDVEYISVHNGVPSGQPPILCVTVHTPQNYL